MQSEFQIQAIKLTAQPKQSIKPTKYVIPKPSSPSQKRSSRNVSQSKRQNTNRTSGEKKQLSEDQIDQIENNKQQEGQQEIIKQIEKQQQEIRAIQEIQYQQKQYINMDERYEYYTQEAKKKELLIELCDGVTFYKAVKPDEYPKLIRPPPLKKRNSNVKNEVVSNNQTEQTIQFATPKSIPKSQMTDLDRGDRDEKDDREEKDDRDERDEREEGDEREEIGDEGQFQSDNKTNVDPDFLVQGDVDGYEMEESQTQMFSYGLDDYISSNNHKNELAEKDVQEEVKPKSEQVFSYYDYYPKDLQDGQIPVPLKQSVNYMNWLRQQKELQQQQQQEQKELK